VVKGHESQGVQGVAGVAFRIPLKTDRASSSDCSSKTLGLAVAPLRSAPHRTALRRLAPTRRENTMTVQETKRALKL
jgi:hypothetical protein